MHVYSQTHTHTHTHTHANMWQIHIQYMCLLTAHTLPYAPLHQLHRVAAVSGVGTVFYVASTCAELESLSLIDESWLVSGHCRPTHTRTVARMSCRVSVPALLPLCPFLSAPVLGHMQSGNTLPLFVLFTSCLFISSRPVAFLTLFIITFNCLPPLPSPSLPLRATNVSNRSLDNEQCIHLHVVRGL